MPTSSVVASPRNIGNRLAARQVELIALVLSLLWLAIYLSTVSPTVNFIDSGELIAAAYEPGIAHPPGYPLYVLLGYVVSHLLWGEVAWRVNVLSALGGAIAVGLLFWLVYQLCSYLTETLRLKEVARVRGRKTLRKTAGRGPTPRSEQQATAPAWWSSTGLHLLAAITAASLLGISATFWSRTAQAKMYTLHYAFIALLLTLALQCRWAFERSDFASARRLLVALAFTLGLSFTNHLMTSLVVPGLIVMVLGGRDWGTRLRIVRDSWKFVLPALLAPLMLYLYLPIRSMQGPVMDWGSTRSWGDFWRHVGGWQYRSYLGGDFRDNLEVTWGYAQQQWLALTVPLLLVGTLSAVMLLRSHWPVAGATLAVAVLTAGFALAYGISEIEPYLVPIYMMAAIWIGITPVLLTLVPHRRIDPSAALLVGGALAVVALVSGALQYPRQDRTNDRVAELLTRNVYSTLPQNSTIITDYWDGFYAPTYYLQNINNVRPDLAIVDMSLLRYPWYTDQLRKMYPWLIEGSADLVERFGAEQRRWVEGQPHNAQLLTNLYMELLTSFVDRHYPGRPAFVFFRPCNPALPPEACESNHVAPNYIRQAAGLVSRLWREPPPDSEIPPEPDYDLRGLTTQPVPLDDFGREAAKYYVGAYSRLGQLYQSKNKVPEALRMFEKAQEVQNAITGR